MRGVASEFGASDHIVKDRFHASSIPVITDTSGRFSRFYDNGVPRGFGYTPPTQRSHDERGSLPDDPDASKYLTTVNHFDKEWLYEMHWGYGLSLQEITARADVGSSAPIYEQMRNQGIPIRDKLEHLRWEPHDGVPELQQANGERLDDHDGTTDANTDYALSRGDTGMDWSGATSDNSDGHRIDDDRLNDPEWLEAAYWERGMTMADIADTCDCSDPTVLRRFKEYDIETRGEGRVADDE
jgi:hypothetical protein